MFYDSAIYVPGGSNDSHVFDLVYFYELYSTDLQLEKTTASQGEALGATLTMQHALFDPESGYTNVNIVGSSGITYPSQETWFLMSTDTVGIEITILESVAPGEYVLSVMIVVGFEQANSNFGPMNQTFKVVEASSMAERIQQMQDELNATITDMMDQLDQMQSDLDGMQTDMAPMQADLNDMQDQIDTMSDQASSAEQKVNDMSMFMYLIIVLVIIVLVVSIVAMVRK